MDDRSEDCRWSDTHQISKRFATRDAALAAGAELRLFTRKDDPIELAEPIVAYRPIWESPLGEPATSEPTDFIPIAARAHTPRDAAVPPATSGVAPTPGRSAPSTAAGGSEIAGQIEKLVELYAAGHLSSEEFALAKSRLLSVPNR